MDAQTSSFCPECGGPLVAHSVAGESRRYGYCPGCQRPHHDLERDCFQQWHVEMTADSYQRTLIETGALGS